MFTNEQTVELECIVTDLEDLALARHSNEEGETFLECKLCDSFDSHKPNCPILVLHLILSNC